MDTNNYYNLVYLDPKTVVLHPTTKDSSGNPIIQIPIGRSVRQNVGKMEFSLESQRDAGVTVGRKWYYLYVTWSGAMMAGFFSDHPPNQQGYYTNTPDGTHDHWKCVGEVYNEDAAGGYGIRPFTRKGNLVYWWAPPLVCSISGFPNPETWTNWTDSRGRTFPANTMAIYLDAAVPENHGNWGFITWQAMSDRVGGYNDSGYRLYPDYDRDLNAFECYWTDYAAFTTQWESESYEVPWNYEHGQSDAFNYSETMFQPILFDNSRTFYISHYWNSDTGHGLNWRVAAYARKSYLGFI